MAVIPLKWLLREEKNLNLRIVKYRWIEDWFPKQCDYGVSISVGGKRYDGRGTADCEVRAIAKACSEAVERYVYLKHLSLIQGGFSIHSFAIT